MPAFRHVAAPCLAVLAATLGGCASAPSPSPIATAPGATLEGVIISIDTSPWAYDGNAVIAVDTAATGRASVELPARWNLCQAAPVDVAALAPGMRVRVTGTADGEGALVVCQDRAHEVVPIR